MRRKNKEITTYQNYQLITFKRLLIQQAQLIQPDGIALGLGMYRLLAWPALNIDAILCLKTSGMQCFGLEG